MTQAIRDQNHVTVALGVSDSDSTVPLPFLIDSLTGRLLVDATGGSGGFTSLNPTETPDGSRKVFTFALASTQPSYIFQDGVWMKATSKAGTVNWTWNSGTKQATMTIPPQDDIEGVA